MISFTISKVPNLIKIPKCAKINTAFRVSFIGLYPGILNTAISAGESLKETQKN
jgi:hypothetical protein